MPDLAHAEDRLPALRTTYNTLDAVEDEAPPAVRPHVTKTIEEVRRQIVELEQEAES